MNIIFWINKGIIYCRITIGGQRAEISTGEKAHRLKNGRTGDGIIDTRLAEIEFKLRKTQLVLDIKGEAYSASDVKRAYETEEIRLPSPKLLEIMKPKDKVYQATISHLKNFLQKRNPKLSELDQGFADRLATYFCEHHKQSSAKVYYSKIVASINQAIKDHPKQKYPDMIEEVPFLTPEILAEQTDQGSSPKYLTLEHYKALKKLKLEGKPDFYRLCFIWQCHTGMAMADINAYNGEFQNMISGQKFLRYHRVKTGAEAIIPVTTEMQSLKLIFPVHLSERSYNYHLKQIGEMIGLPQMTSHWGRHTFGVMKLIEGFSMESIRKMMGHTSVSTTEKVYAQVTLDKLFTEMRSAK